MGVGMRCALCVLLASPACHEQRKISHALAGHRHVTSSEMPRVLIQSVPPARCSFPRHFGGTLSGRVYMYRGEPASDRRRFRLKSSSPTTLILDHSTSQLDWATSPAPSYPRILQ